MESDETRIVVSIIEINTIQVSGLNSSEREALGARIRRMKLSCDSQVIMEYATSGMLNIKTGIGMQREDRTITTQNLATIIQAQLEARVWR